MLLFFSGIASGVNISAWQAFVPQLVARDDLLARRAPELDAVRRGTRVRPRARRARAPAVRRRDRVLRQRRLLRARARRARCSSTRDRPFDVDAGPGLEHFREARRLRARPCRPSDRRVLTITVVSFLGSSVQQLAPAFADDVVRRGQERVRIPDLGVRDGRDRRIARRRAPGPTAYLRSRVTVVGLLFCAGGRSCFGAASRRTSLGSLALVVMGAAYLLVATALNTSLQARVDEAHRGRAISIYLMGLLAGVPFGALILEGKLADVVGLRRRRSSARRRARGVRVIAVPCGSRASGRSTRHSRTRRVAAPTR